MAKSQGWNVYDVSSRAPMTSYGSSYYQGGSMNTAPIARTVYDIQASFGHPGQNPSESTKRQVSPGGGGGGISSGQAGGMMTDPYQQLDIWKQIADFQQRQNTATREPVLGLYNNVSGAYSGRIAADPYNAGSVGLMEGSLKDAMQAQINAQKRQLQSEMARRGGAVGYGAANELEARRQRLLGDLMRQVRSEAIDKNRAALEKAMALETALAAQKAEAYYKLPVAVDLPSFSKQDPESGLRSQYSSYIKQQYGDNPGQYGGMVPSFEQWKSGTSGGSGGNGSSYSRMGRLY